MVQHVLGLKKNLISLRMLDSKGFGFSSSNGVLEVFKGDKVMSQRKISGNLYRLVGNVLTNGAIVNHETRSTIGGYTR